MADADHRRRGSRFRARRRAVSFLYEAEIRDLDVVALAEERRVMGQESPEFHDVAPYTTTIVSGVAERLSRVDEMISEHLRDWTLDRLPGVDRAVLRVGTWELLYGPEDVDTATVIDQAVLLVSDLSAEKSVPYVNAVLDRVAGLAAHIRAAEAAVSSLGQADEGTDETAERAPESTPESGGTPSAD